MAAPISTAEINDLRNKFGNQLITEWQTFVPTFADWTNVTGEGWWRLVGDSLDLRYRCTFTGAPTLSTTGMLTSIPDGFTVNGDKQFSATSGRNGIGSVEDVSATTPTYYQLELAAFASDSHVRWFTKNSNTSFTTVGAFITTILPITFNTGDIITGQLFGVPIR